MIHEFWKLSPNHPYIYLHPFPLLLLHISHTNIRHVSIGPVGTFPLLPLPPFSCISSPEPQPFQCCHPPQALILLFFDIPKHSMTLLSEFLDLATNLDHLSTACARIHYIHHCSASNTHFTTRLEEVGYLPLLSQYRSTSSGFYSTMLDNLPAAGRSSHMYGIISINLIPFFYHSFTSSINSIMITRHVHTVGD